MVRHICVEDWNMYVGVYRGAYLSADPVKLPVTVQIHPLHEVREQFTQVVVVWRLEEVQTTYILQILGQLICNCQNTRLAVTLVDP